MNNFLEIFFPLGHLQDAIKEYKEAIKYYEMAPKISQTCVKAHTNLAIILENQGIGNESICKTEFFKQGTGIARMV